MPKPRAFEPWMLTNLVSGAVMSAFLILLIPPFITEVTGDPARVGVVFAVLSLAALLGPVFGRIADRFERHRVVFVSSFAAMALAFAVLALDASGEVYSPIAGVLLGAGISAKSSVGSAFLVGSGLPEAVQAKQLTVSNLLGFGGQILGGALVGVLHLTGVGYPGQFWVATALIAAGGVFGAFTTGTAARRLAATAHAGPVSGTIAEHPIGAPAYATAPADAAPTDAAPTEAAAPDAATARIAPTARNAPSDARPSFSRIVLSPFGALLGVTAFGGLAFAGLSSQLANVFPAVFGIGASGTSVLIAVSGVLGIPIVILTGMWLARSGPGPALGASALARAAGFAVLALLGLLTAAPWVAVLAAAGYLVVAASGSLQRSPFPRAAAVQAPVAAAEANGFVTAAGAVGGFVGCLAAGLVAQMISYDAVLWLSAIASVAALALVPAMLGGLRAARGLATPSGPAEPTASVPSKA